MSPEEIYHNLGQLLAATPDFAAHDRLQSEETIWMAKAYALLKASGMSSDSMEMKVQMDLMTTATPHYRPGYAAKIAAVLHRALAVAEINAPTSVRGAFISAGSAFDAMAAVGRVLAQASVSARIVDPYMDEKALTDFALLGGPSVKIELLADISAVKATLKPAVSRWQAQYANDRPLEAKLSAARSLHDRLIIVDGSSVFTLTQSLNAFAARSPASIVKLEGDAVPLKIAAYDAFWKVATPI
ncbi:phosphatidylserine/phosphatidylglycerophosphate/cardiolipin synthase family protein [Agrobacterium tumefaciens]